MTTPQWTIDDGGRLAFNVRPAPKGEPWCDDLIDHRPTAMRHAIIGDESFAALVADVAAARLVDDMAALLREIVEIDDRFGAHTKECITDPNDACGLCLELAAEQSHSIEAAREVAALHHARQQEGT